VLKKSLIWKFIYWARDLRSQEVFEALKKHCRGDVLDVGGWDFFLTVKKKNLTYNSWTTLETSEEKDLELEEENFKFIHGDGCNMQFNDNQFDLILNIQVLEHVLEPIKMVNEISRVLKPAGYAIFLIPQTGVIHHTPEHYYNFTRFWITKVMERARLEIIELKPLGGVWSTIASRMVYFFPQSIQYKGLSTKECKRNFLFYLLYPLMALYATISIPLCLLLSCGDLTEEPNNHFVLVRKKIKDE